MSKPPLPAKPLQPGVKMRPHIKRQLIVNPRFQFMMLIPIGIFAVVLAVLVVVFLFMPIQHDAAHDPNPHVRALLSARLLTLHLYFWPSYLFAGVVSSLYTLIRSNRLAGPLYKLRVVLLQQAEGKSLRIRFREGDDLREFEDVVNRVAKRMDSLTTGTVLQLSAIQRRLKFLKTRLESQTIDREDLCNELDLALKDAALD